jgi:hypothetical protein
MIFMLLPAMITVAATAAMAQNACPAAAAIGQCRRDSGLAQNRAGKE